MAAHFADTPDPLMDGVIGLIIQYKYLILFPLAAVEGPAVSLVAGLLASMGYLELVPAFCMILMGDFLPDIGYYLIGRHARSRPFFDRFTTERAFVAKHLPVLETLWHEHGRKTMVISKLAYGLSTPLLMSAGFTNMPANRYVAYVLPISLLKCMVIMGLGYALVQSYMEAVKYLQNAGLMFAALAIAMVAGYVLLARRARRSFFEQASLD